MKKFFRLKLPLALAVIALASYVVFLEVEASDESDEQIGPSSVWRGSDNQLHQIQQSCKGLEDDAYLHCFTSQMANMGASSEAIDFTQEYADDHDGRIAVLRGFHALDAVDLGYAFFPDDPESKQGWVLLNGSPDIFNVDDQESVPREQLSRNPQFLALSAAHPNAGIYPDSSQRPEDGMPQVKKTVDGGQQFIVDYAVRDGCRTCALLGIASYSFDFAPSGTFRSANLIKVAVVTGSRRP
ncbi:MAG TPA: hypothetical protein VFI72_15410 [Candidatus Angelobacter sp.]|nr:hypothetical protein [Candidatus Angelobacter sp.]